MPAPTQGTVIAAIDVQMYLPDNENAQANAGGKMFFWQDTNRLVGMPVYTQVLGSGPPTYTYAALPNPITLSPDGTPQDAAGNDVAIYYWPYNPITGAIQQYFVQVFDSNGNLQATREAWPPLWAINSGNITTVINGINAGRLTLTSGVPVTTTDVTGANATTIYYTPYKGNGILLYTNGSWETYTFNEINIPIPAVANQMYDVFASPVGANVALNLVAWANATTRATAIILLNGIYVSAANNSFRYLGSFSTTGSAGQTEDSVANRFLWNYSNRILRNMYVQLAGGSWAYNTEVWRQSNASTTNQLNLVVGVSEDIINTTFNSMIATTSTMGDGTNGIGINSITVNSAVAYPSAQYGGADQVGVGNLSCSYTGYLPIGKNYLACLEIAAVNGVTSFFGTGTINGTPYQTAIQGILPM